MFIPSTFASVHDNTKLKLQGKIHKVIKLLEVKSDILRIRQTII